MLEPLVPTIHFGWKPLSTKGGLRSIPTRIPIKFSETLRCADFFFCSIRCFSSYNLSKDYGAVGDGVHDDTAAIKFFFFLNLPSPYSPRRLPAPQLLTKADVEVDLVNLQRRESIMSHDNKI